MTFQTGDPFEYDSGQFLDYLDQAYQRWKETETYRTRVDRRDAPESISSFEDIYEIPVVDMAEFKNSADDLAVDPETVTGHLYSSGTITGTRSRAARSEVGFKRQREFLATLTTTVLPDVDYFGVMGPSEAHLNEIGDPMMEGRSVFNYVNWGFADPFPTEHFMELSGGEPTVDFAGLVEALQSRDGTRGVFGTQRSVLGLIEYLDQTGERLDLGPDGVVCTGGGSAKSLDGEAFRGRVSDYLGVDPANHVDFYGCTESMLMTANHYDDENPDEKRVPRQGFVYVVDEDELREQGKLVRVENGTPGVGVLVDAMNLDHPSVILTDDVIVKTGGEYGPDVRIVHKSRSSM